MMIYIRFVNLLFIGILVEIMRFNIPLQIRNNYYKIQKVFLFLIATILIVWMFPNKILSFKFEFQKGKPWMHETLIAPYDFPVYKSNEQLIYEQENLRDNFKLTFVMDESAFDIKAEDFISNFEQKWSVDKNVSKDTRFTFLISIKKELKNKKEKLANYGLKILEELYTVGIIQMIDDIESKDSDYEIIIMKGNVGQIVSLSNLYTIESASKKVYNLKNISQEESNFLSPLILEMLKQNVFYDESTTAKMLDSELKAISKGLGMGSKRGSNYFKRRISYRK